MRRLVLPLVLLLTWASAGLAQASGPFTNGDWVYMLNTAYSYRWWHPPDGAIILSYLGTNQSVVVPESIDGHDIVHFGVSYGTTMFQSSSPTNVIIPDGIEHLGGSAFTGAQDAEVWIGSGVQYIEEFVFAVERLRSINVSPNNYRYASVDGVLFENSYVGEGDGVLRGKALRAYPSLRPGDSYTIPQGTEVIAVLAFHAAGLKRVDLPNSVTTIMEGAFSGCALTNLTVPASVALIKYDVFNGCSFPSALFLGDAPVCSEFGQFGPQLVYYIQGTAGWGDSYCGVPTYMIGTALDDDSDGLNDLAEFRMAALGFDWQVPQPSLVAALYDNANDASLFTQSQYDTHHSNGVTEGMGIILSNAASYGLYDSNSIMELNMGGVMVQKAGANAEVVLQLQTAEDLASGFTNNGPPITNSVPMNGNKGFMRIRALGNQ